MNVAYKIMPVVLIVLLVVVFFITKNALTKKQHYVQSTGKIVELHEEKSEAKIGSDAYNMISPVIEYSYNGGNHRVIGNYFSKSMKIGDEIEILVDKNNPENAIVKKGIYIAPIITSVVFVAFLVFYIVLVILKKNKIF